MSRSVATVIALSDKFSLIIVVKTVINVELAIAFILTFVACCNADVM
jgi:hypothetical protein